MKLNDLKNATWVERNEFLSRYSLSVKRCISRLFRLFVQHKHLTSYVQPNGEFFSTKIEQSAVLVYHMNRQILNALYDDRKVNEIICRSFRYLISWRYARWKLVYCVHASIVAVPIVTLHSIRMIFTLMIFIGIFDLCYCAPAYDSTKIPAASQCCEIFKFIW